jgi:hypothetical protein
VEPVRHGRFAMGHPFLDLPNVIGSPHNSAGGGEWRDEYLRRAVQNCRRAVLGESPWNLIGPRGVCKCALSGRSLVYLNTGKDNFLVCGAARRGLCENRYHRTYAKLEADLLAVLSLFDYSRLLDRADPRVHRIATLLAEIADIDATVERLLADFSAATPPSVSRRIMTLERRRDALAGELLAEERATRIADAARPN